jgi:hypothetical protein
MTLVEAAETILGKSANTELTAREITEQAIKEDLIKPKSDKPWVHMQSAIRESNQRLLASGKKERFSFAAGKWKLN